MRLKAVDELKVWFILSLSNYVNFVIYMHVKRLFSVKIMIDYNSTLCRSTTKNKMEKEQDG